MAPKRRSLGSHKSKDFQKTKLKAGKKKIPSNATDTTLNVRNVQIVQHLKNKNQQGENGATTTVSMTLPQVISQCKHHAQKLRKDGLSILISMIEAEADQEFFRYNPMQILGLLGQTLTDNDYEVRSACLACFEIFYKAVEKQQHDDFHNQVIAYTNCALTHPEPSIQMTGLKAITIVLLNTPLSPKLVSLLKTCLDVSSSSGVLRGSEAAIGFVEKVGKFSRQLAYSRKTDTNEQIKGEVQHDCGELVFSDYMRPDSRKSLESEFLTEDFFKKMMRAVISLWPLEVSRFELDQKKAQVLLKLVKTMGSILINIDGGKEKGQYLERLRKLFPIVSKKSSEPICRINFYMAKELLSNQHVEIVQDWITTDNATIKQIFTYITDFPEVLQFFEELTQKSENIENSEPNNSIPHSFSVSEVTEQFVLHSIIKIKTTKEQSQQTTLIDSVLDKFLYKNDSLTELFVSNIYTKNIKMGSILIRYLIDTKQFTKILENVSFVEDKIAVQKLLNFLPVPVIVQNMRLLVKNYKSLDLLNLTRYLLRINKGLDSKLIISLLLTTAVRCDEFSTNATDLVRGILEFVPDTVFSEFCGRVPADRPLLLAKMYNSAPKSVPEKNISEMTISTDNINTDLLLKLTPEDRKILNKYVK